MRTLELKDASKPLAEYAAGLGDGGIILTSKKKPVAALVSVKGADSESLALSMNPTFLKLIRRARAEVKRGKVISLQQVKQQISEQTASPKIALPRKRRRATRG